MFNRYAYTFNDPVNLTDPTGQCPLCAPALGGYLANEARRGAVKGAAAGVGTSLAIQGIAGEGFSTSTTVISGVKGGLVGATHEVFESTALTSGVAFVAGYVDGAVTHAANGGDIKGALTQGAAVALIDSAGASIGARYGDEAGAAAGIALSTAATKLPAVADVLQSGSADLGALGNAVVDNIVGLIPDPPDQVRPDDF